MKLRVLFKKLFNDGPFVGAATIPKKDNMSPHMPVQLAEKSDNLRGLDVFVAVKLRIKRNPLPSGRDTYRGNRRNLGSAAGATQDRGGVNLPIFRS